MSTKKSSKQDDTPSKRAAEPANASASTKRINKWTAYWCIHHMAWTRHGSDECKLGNCRAYEQQQRNYKAASSTIDPAIQHQQDFTANLAGLSCLHE